jgi:hypothetical protein
MGILTCSAGCKYSETKDTEMPCRECLETLGIKDEAGMITKFIHYEPEEQNEQPNFVKFSFTKGISKKVNKCHTE